MLNPHLIETILGRLPSLRIGVVGDLFLDRYLEIDPELTEPSIETGLDAYQVVRVRSCPGAAGTIVNNLAALGVGSVPVISVIGDDGEGFELRQAIRQLSCVDLASIYMDDSAPTVRGFTRRTPTYTKPLVLSQGQPPRELNRLDIKNRTPLAQDMENRIIEALATSWPALDALLVLDQVSEAECGVITSRVRKVLSDLGKSAPEKFILVDSRERIGEFRDTCLKPNQMECRRAGGFDDQQDPVERLAVQADRPVFCTCGAAGIIVANPRDRSRVRAPGYPVSGAIDPVGAGDSTSAAIACAMSCGASLVEAAAFGNLVASITIQQIGTTGTATPDQVRRRWQEVV